MSMQQADLIKLLDELTSQSHECEWLEFKENFHSPDEIGQYISALANAACLHEQKFSYLIYGVKDGTREIVGTSFKVKQHLKGNEGFENWLINRLSPKIDFHAYEFDYKPGVHISLFVIPAAKNQPVSFLHTSYIRVGSSTRKLNEFPDKEAKIWRDKKNNGLENEIAKSHLSAADVVQELSTETYFDLLKLPYPSSREGVIDKLLSEGIVLKEKDAYCITKLGAILFAKNLNDFESVSRKAIRVIVYKGKNKIETIREQIGTKGYALGFSGLVDWINSQLPANEEIGKALRTETRMYPELAIRELVANALIHQDFMVKGFPMIEIYSDRLEISNPGQPLIQPERFIDEYISRNDKLADLMRRMGYCEEKGSGLDKVIFHNELYQLPAINVLISDNRTTVTMYSYMPFNSMEKKDKIRACYQHACLKYVSNEKMTNQTLRDRFKIESQNYSIASRIIRDAVEDGRIKEVDPSNKSRKYSGYIPFWA